jgi:hypothetical protein
MSVPQWRRLVDHVQSVPERIYETWNSSDGWDNLTQFGREYGEDGVSWCVIFDWDMYHDVGLDSIVPRTDNVSSFTDWARARGQWSEYPSVGAWVNFGNGAHTEIVVGFDADTVYTKGGNSVKAGSTDAGQGNGVWSHATARRSARVVGYFAPRFPDGVFPPTADPHDPRGGTAVTSWRWPGPAEPSTPSPSEEDDMPTAAEVAEAVWSYQIDDPTKAGTQYTPIKTVEWFAAANAASAAVQVTALTAAVKALADAKPGVDTAAVVTAVQKAIADAVVNVNVNVTGKGQS